MKNIITIDSIDSIYQMKLENLGEHFEYLKNLGYNIFIGVSTIDDIYLSIQLPQPTQLTDKIKVFNLILANKFLNMQRHIINILSIN